MAIIVAAAFLPTTQYCTSGGYVVAAALSPLACLLPPPSCRRLYPPPSSLTTALALAPSSVFDPTDAPFSTPLVILLATMLGVLAQSWINKLLDGEEGLGAFLSDGTGYNKSAFKPRKRFVTDDERGGADPLPWLKLPELDFVDVAGQPKKTKRERQQQDMVSNSSESSNSDNEAEVVSRLEFLFAQMKSEVENDNLIEAKRIELELEKIMEEEGFNFSSKQ